MSLLMLRVSMAESLQQEKDHMLESLFCVQEKRQKSGVKTYSITLLKHFNLKIIR